MESRIALRARHESTLLQMVKAFESAPSAWDVVVWTESCQADVVVSDAPGEGDVYFDPEVPAASVAAVETHLSTTSLHVTAVTGARRGTGVTTLALHLACSLAQSQSVCLVDLDPSSSLRARLDLPDDARDWGTAGERVLDAALPVAGGFRLLLAPQAPRGADVRDLVRRTAAEFDRVVVDAPRSPWLAPTLEVASAAVLIVPPSRQGLAAARTTLELHASAAWACVVNRLGAGGELSRSAVRRALGRPIAIELPASPFLRDREDDHRLLIEKWSRYYRRVCRLAAAL